MVERRRAPTICEAEVEVLLSFGKSIT